MNDVIEGEARPLAVIRDEEPAQTPALFGTSDPVDVIAHATRVADALKGVIVAKKLVSNIQGKEYPQVEAWQTLAVMLGLATICEWTRQVEGGWEARVIVQRNGLTIAAAEAQCTRGEKAWRSRDDYALRSMAQTRATSKSLRSVLGFIMVLAGYQATPAEEVPKDGFEPSGRGRQSHAKSSAKDPTPASAPKSGQMASASEAPQPDPDEARKKALAAIHALKSDRGIDDAFYGQVLIDLFGDACYDAKGKPSAAMIEDIRDLRKFWGHLNARSEPLPPEPKEPS